MDSEEILTCPVCNGWGSTPLPLDAHFKSCPNCHGDALQLSNPKFILYWDMPGYFDYSGRQRSRIGRYGLIVVILVVITGTVLLLVFLASQTLNLI